MNQEVDFKETQRFTQWWLWLLILAIGGISTFSVFRQYFDAMEPGGTPVGVGAWVAAFAPVGFIVALFLLSVLHTEIGRDGIQVRFFPYHLSPKKFRWDEIALCYTRTYKALSEYGGYGIKGWISQSGKAYNVSGNEGLQLVFKDGTKLLIGTQKSQEIKTLLEKSGNWKAPDNR